MEAALETERSAAGRKAAVRPRARRAKMARPCEVRCPLHGDARLRALLCAMEPHLEQIQARLVSWKKRACEACKVNAPYQTG